MNTQTQKLNVKLSFAQLLIVVFTAAFSFNAHSSENSSVRLTYNQVQMALRCFQNNVDVISIKQKLTRSTNNTYFAKHINSIKTEQLNPLQSHPSHRYHIRAGPFPVIV